MIPRSRLRMLKSAIVVVVVLTRVPATAYAQPSDRKDADTHYKAALAAMADGNLDAAQQELETAADLAPDNPLVQYQLAILNHKQGETYQAIEYLWEAMRLGLPPEIQKTADDMLPVWTE